MATAEQLRKRGLAVRTVTRRLPDGTLVRFHVYRTPSRTGRRKKTNTPGKGT